MFLTFDDGGESAYTTIAPLLERRSWRGHFFVTTSYVGRPGFLTAHQIRVLHERGHSVGSHSHSHPAWMASCNASDLEKEWVTSAQILSDILGEPARVASVPGGDYSPARRGGHRQRRVRRRVYLQANHTRRANRQLPRCRALCAPPGHRARGGGGVGCRAPIPVAETVVGVASKAHREIGGSSPSSTDVPGPHRGAGASGMTRPRW